MKEILQKCDSDIKDEGQSCLISTRLKTCTGMTFKQNRMMLSEMVFDLQIIHGQLCDLRMKGICNLNHKMIALKQGLHLSNHNSELHMLSSYSTVLLVWKKGV